MNNLPPYAPILKNKLCEERVLVYLSPTEKQQIKPLMELVPKVSFKENGKIRVEKPKNEILLEFIAKYQNPKCLLNVFLDVSPLYEDDEKINALEVISQPTTILSSINNNVTPVITVEDIERISSHPNLVSQLKGTGIALRIYREQANDKLLVYIDKALAKINLNRSEVDIFYDFQVTQDNDVTTFTEFAKKDLDISKWRSVYFASGFFPVNLTVFKDPDVYYLKREDFSNWEQIYKIMKGIRPIGFSDYSIQHPIIEDPMYIPKTSKSIRYTEELQWIIFKGQASNAKNNAGEVQYFSHTQTMMDLNHFAGESCCMGDKYIKLVYDSDGKLLGNAPKWLQVGFNHHFCITIRQVSNMN